MGVLAPSGQYSPGWHWPPIPPSAGQAQVAETFSPTTTGLYIHEPREQNLEKYRFLKAR